MKRIISIYHVIDPLKEAWSKPSVSEQDREQVQKQSPNFHPCLVWFLKSSNLPTVDEPTVYSTFAYWFLKKNLNVKFYSYLQYNSAF